MHLEMKKNRINNEREQNSDPDPPYYKYTPEQVIETETRALCWDRTIRTDRETPCNRPEGGVEKMEQVSENYHNFLECDAISGEEGERGGELTNFNFGRWCARQEKRHGTCQ